MRRFRPWLVGLALALPLVALAAWIARGALHPADLASPSSLPPATDYPAGRLEQRVDGAADALRAAGCERLRHWRLAAPAADAEALYFRSAEAAREALAREAGPERTPGPGEEAQVGPQAVYFRRGAVLVRVFADPGAPADAAPALLHAARVLDRAVQAEP
jgi:hypothetical protein